MTGGSTIVEFWRNKSIATSDGSQTDDALLLQQAVHDLEAESADAEGGERAARRTQFAFAALALLWLAFAGWATVTSGQWRAGPAAWPGLVATLLVPIVLLGVCYLLLARTSRTESRRYLDTARALRSEAELLELRLARITKQLETARQTMQDQAELLDSYGAAASSNMEASAELIASRANSTTEKAEAAERAGTILVARMDALIASIPELEERAARMAVQIVDNGHALAERIDTLEARLHAVGELSDDARARTLSATKSLSSQLTQLQEATRSATDEVNGLADIASGRLDATAQSARQLMTDSAADLDRQAGMLASLMERARSGLTGTSQAVMDVLTQDMGRIEADLRQRLEAAVAYARENLATADRDLTTQAASLHSLVEAAQAGIAATSHSALTTLARDAEKIDADLRDRLDTVIARARDAMAITDEGLARQSEALDTLIARSRDNIESIGDESVSAISDHMSEVEGRLHQINDLVEGQRTLVAGLHATLGEAVDAAQSRFAVMEETALNRNQRLTEALARLTSETQRIDSALAAGGVTAEKLISCAETLLVALDSSVRELDETFPAALQRFDARITTSRALLDSAAPEMERLEAISEALVGRTQEAEELLRGQGRRLTEWLESTQSGVEANRELVEKLRTALDNAHQDATRITEGAGPLLVTALLRVKDTADQAAERARQALGRAIPDAAQSLAEASEKALQQAVDDKVTAQIELVAKVAEEAVKAAHQASDRLTRQLLTIADTSASVQAKIEEAERATEDRDRDNFARRSALLIESLNSTSIDVAKILSNDVTDSAWSAYLKGDRGVFTRRAVKLLDAGESREIALHYDNDLEFQEHVNRYIHDFESMLRIILSARDGNALGVAILSSDMGKLYVALAQAIERLRQ
jgi:predicted transcriptional regulator